MRSKKEVPKDLKKLEKELQGIERIEAKDRLEALEQLQKRCSHKFEPWRSDRGDLFVKCYSCGYITEE